MSMPRMRSRSHWAAICFTLVAIVVGAAWVWFTDPANRGWVAGALPVIVVLSYLGIAQRVMLQTEPPALAWSAPGLWRRRVPLDEHTTVRLRGAGATVYLHARRPDRRVGVALDLLALTEYTRRSRHPDELAALCEALRRSRARGASEVVHRLREQAAHLQAGGDVGSSPLARHTGRSLLGLRY
jgi:hypothetical protein